MKHAEIDFKNSPDFSISPNIYSNFGPVDEKHSFDYIIVGQGLAGSCLAIQMLKAGKRVIVLDQPAKNTSSAIAAGMFNPVTGQNLVKTWLADETFSYLKEFYSISEQLLHSRFFFPMQLYRPFASVEEQNEWMGRSTNVNYTSVLENIFLAPTFTGLRDPYGGILLKPAGYVNTKNFVEATTTWLRNQGAFLETDFDYSKLAIGEADVEYNGLRARKIVFCEGTRVASNPWFRSLPIRSLKGETISIKCGWTKHVMLNRGVYMVPGSGQDEWRVGATYNLKDKSEQPTLDGRIELEEKLNELASFPYTITGHDWGFRPTTVDRRPMLGLHPFYKPLAIFNGLGTKGVSLAPYFSLVLFRWLENQGDLHKEVNITRYKILY